MSIPLSRPYHSEQIDRRILEVVHSGNFVLGPECRAFEQELATYLGVKHVVLSSSWTAATQLLHVAQCMVGQLRRGDEILVPSLTAFPTVEPLIHAGLSPVFCEVDDDGSMNLDSARRRMSQQTIGILPVHLYGRPVDMTAVQDFAKEFDLIVIEDCAQAIGAKWDGRRVGSFGQHATFSFYASKNLTVYGDGGAIATGDDEIASLIRQLRNHGRSDKTLHDHVGYNLRFNEIQAAVGREQLLVIDRLNASRRKVASWYRRELADVSVVRLPADDTHTLGESVYHLFVIQLPTAAIRQGLIRSLSERGIETGIHYPIPIHRQPAISRLFGHQGSLPRTDLLVDRILSLPMFPSMTEKEVIQVATGIKAFFSGK